MDNFDKEWFFLVSELNDMVMCIEDGEQGAELVTWHRTGEEDQLWKFDDEGRLVNKTGLVADIEGGDGEEGASVIGWERNDDDEAENQKWRYEDGMIFSEMNEMVMDIDSGISRGGQKIVTWPMHGRPWQKWRVEYPCDEDPVADNPSLKTWYFVESLLNGMVLDVAKAQHGGNLCLWHKHGNSNQLWRFDSEGRLISKLGFAADIRGRDDSEGAEVIGWMRNYEESENQLWSFVDGVMISQMNTLVMDVKDEGEDEGKIVHMWEQHDGDNQKWKLTEAKTEDLTRFAGKWLTIESELNGLVLSVEDGQAGGNLVVSRFTGGDHQIWTVDEKGNLMTKSGLLAEIKEECREKYSELIGSRNNGKSDTTQSWRYEYGLIVSELNGLVIDVDGGEDVEGQRVVTWTRHGAPWQKWKLRTLEQGREIEDSSDMEDGSEMDESDDDAIEKFENAREAESTVNDGDFELLEK